MSTLEDVFINLSKIIRQKDKDKEELKQEDFEYQQKTENNNRILYDENNYNVKYNICEKICRYKSIH